MTPALFVENLEKYFPAAPAGWRVLTLPFAAHTQCALAGISLAIAPGEAVALIGANGAGKSTLLRILATLLMPTRGRACVAGFDVVRAPAGARASLGYHTGADSVFYGRLTARENLEFFAALSNLSRSDSALQISLSAQHFGLGPVLDRQVRTLSTGMIHRLGLVRAILRAPSVLLLDEPTRSLDPVTAAEFRRSVREDLVRGRGAALLFATHNLSEAADVADRIAILGAGRLLAFDTPAALAQGQPLEKALENILRDGQASNLPHPAPNGSPLR